MKLEKYLILNKYLLSLFGVNSISDLREELKNKKEGACKRKWRTPFTS